MDEKETVQAEQKELTVEDLEAVAGGYEADQEVDGGVEIGKTTGGNEDVKVA